MKSILNTTAVLALMMAPLHPSMLVAQDINIGQLGNTGDAPQADIAQTEPVQDSPETEQTDAPTDPISTDPVTIDPPTPPLPQLDVQIAETPETAEKDTGDDAAV